jgi:hypothetical protein
MTNIHPNNNDGALGNSSILNELANGDGTFDFWLFGKSQPDEYDDAAGNPITFAGCSASAGWDVNPLIIRVKFMLSVDPT